MEVKSLDENFEENGKDVRNNDASGHLGAQLVKRPPGFWLRS